MMIVQKRSTSSFIGEHARLHYLPKVDPRMTANSNQMPGRSTCLMTPRASSAPPTAALSYLRLSRKQHVFGSKDAILRSDVYSVTRIARKQTTTSVGRWQFSGWRHRIIIGFMCRSTV